MYFNREKSEDILEGIQNFPVIAITGPRQCGKSTLVKQLLEKVKNYIYLDLELPSDLKKIEDPEWFFTSQKDKLICIDEVQRKPELFPLMRSLVDKWNRPSCFLILGSASREMLKQSSESLAGRIIYKQLTPFLWNEIQQSYSIENYIEKGGFPRSLLSSSTKFSIDWRRSFIQTFLEKDLRFWTGFSTDTMRKLWQMLAHNNGQILNASVLASSLGVSNVTIKNYIDLLSGTFMLDVVPPYFSNLGKRLVKSPKVYISDSGITAGLLNLNDFAQMNSHPAYGAIWEQIVLTNLKGNFDESEIFFYRSSNGAECDFVLKMNNKIFAIECKASYSPNLTKGNFNAFEDINANKIFVVCPIEKGWPMKANIDVVSISELIQRIKEY